MYHLTSLKAKKGKEYLPTKTGHKTSTKQKFLNKKFIYEQY